MIPYRPQDIIIAPNRQRQEFDPEALEELKASIDGKALQHAPVVRMEDGKPVLVAGERRLRVIADIFALEGFFWYDGVKYTDTVPTVTLGELDELAAEEAELDENLRRRDLTWQELAAAHTRLHLLRQKQKGLKLEQAIAGTVDGDPFRQAMIDSHDFKQTVADTAKEIHGRSDGYYQDSVRQELIVAQHLHKPEVAKAKSVAEAFKILKRSETAQANRDLAAKIGASHTADVHTVVNDDCIAWMVEAIAAGKRFPVILTDAPYGMGAQDFGDGGGKLAGIEHHYDDSYESWKKLMTAWCPLSYAIAADQAHAYVFCDLDRYHELKAMMQAAGWYVHRTPLIDYKTDSGRVPLPDRGPRRQWEMILYAIKGDKPVTHIYPDVIPCQADPNMTHGAQKPVSLFVNLLKRSVRPGDEVLDTFGGSGTLIPAAHSLYCKATVIEAVAEYYGMCLRRLQTLEAAVDPLKELENL